MRELEKVDQHNQSVEWRVFARKLRRLLRDAIRLRKRPDFTPDRYKKEALRLGRRLDALALAEYRDPDAQRLGQRLLRHNDYILTFLDYQNVPYDNNFGERQIRPAVILRKNSQSNRSDRGAVTQAVLMSVYRTLRLRGLNPTKTIADVLKTYLTTGNLPPRAGRFLDSPKTERGRSGAQPRGTIRLRACVPRPDFAASVRLSAPISSGRMPPLPASDRPEAAIENACHTRRSN